MIKRILLYTCCLVSSFFSLAQTSSVDSLKVLLAASQNDTSRMLLLGELSEEYTEINPDSSYQYGVRMLELSNDLGLYIESAFASVQMGYALNNLGSYPRSLQTLLSAATISEDPSGEKKVLSNYYPPIDEFTDRSLPPHTQRLNILARSYQYLGIVYTNMGNYDKAFSYFREAISITEQTKNLRILSISYSTLSRVYLLKKHNDSAKLCLLKSYEFAQESGFKVYLGSVLLNLGRVYDALGNQDSAKIYFKKAVVVSRDHNYFRGIVASNIYLSALYKKQGSKDSSLYFIQQGLPIANDLNSPDLLVRLYRALADFYKTAGNSDSTVKYQSLVIRINDSLFNAKQARDFQNIDFDEQQRQQEIEKANTAYRNKFRLYVLGAGLAIFLLVVIILWRNSLHRKRSNIILSRQKNELESALKSLTATQKQLIQSEKMASLGELTAGIAHEIQNPLNFVNNFSDINTELIDEMNKAIDENNTAEAKILSEDIRQNNEKITFHGKRADSIVKGMLQHSRVASRQKEITDINGLVDEYLRLAYHGLRAKDKSFNAKFESDFDNSVKPVSIIPQDIGRVILNLINNAFYAVNEKKINAGTEYEPTVIVSTKNLGDKIEIKVKDNGNGIPSNVVDKIFQPFFTTKPTGEGTGLGLSLSYDIVKAHGGDFKVETKENEGTAFTIDLPVAD